MSASNSKHRKPKSSAGGSASAQKKALKVTSGLLLGLVAVFFAAFGIDYFVNKDNVPRGATVAGVQIGNMSSSEAQAKLEQELGASLDRPVTVTAGKQKSTVQPAAAGLSINWEETVDQAGKQSLNPVTWVKSFLSERELDLKSDVDPGKFKAELDRVQNELTIKPVDGHVNLDGGTVNAVDPIIGQNVDSQQLRDELTMHWLQPDGITVDTTEARPKVDAAQVKEMADGPAARAVSAPIVAKGRDGIDGIIPVERMAEVVSFEPKDGKLAPKVNSEAAEKILDENLAGTEAEMQNAVVSVVGGAKSVTPHVDGVTVDWKKTMADFENRVIGDAPRDFEAVYIDEPAEYTTEEADQARFDQVIGEFTTGGFSPESGVNIALTANIVNGAFVAPGETFSLNGYTGPRGSAQGFVESGIILNGRADKAVGGGISQFATTLYNAAYFAGMEDVAHTPHSYYIDRYPAGREATVYEGAIDLQFKNNAKTPVIIEAWVADGSLTVRLMGTKTVEVESVNGGRWGHSSPETLHMSGDKCIASSGTDGFTTSDTRIIRDLNGSEISRETTTTVYDPQPIVVCG